MSAQWFDLPVGPLDRACPDADDGPGRARRTRELLIATAARRFAACGYHGTTLRDVLTDTGLTKGALYFHFGSKLALARAVCHGAAERWGATLAGIEARELDPLQEILAGSDVVFVHFTGDVSLGAALRVVAESEELADLLGDWRHDWEQRIAAQLQRARAQRLLRRWVEPEPLSRHIVAMMLGHHSHSAGLAVFGHDPWPRLNQCWEDLLVVVATRSWVEEWRGSGWRARRHPATYS